MPLFLSLSLSRHTHAYAHTHTHTQTGTCTHKNINISPAPRTTTLSLTKRSEWTWVHRQRQTQRFSLCLFWSKISYFNCYRIVIQLDSQHWGLRLCSGSICINFCDIAFKESGQTACKVHDSKVFTGGHSGVFCLTCTVNNASLQCAVLHSHGIVWGHLHRKERMNTLYLRKCLSWTYETVMNGCTVTDVLHKSQKGGGGGELIF